MRQELVLHPEDVKAAIRKEFGSLKAFELEKGLPDRSARDVLRGRASARTHSAISEFLGVRRLIILNNTKSSISIRAKNTRSNGDSQRLNAGTK